MFRTRSSVEELSFRASRQQLVSQQRCRFPTGRVSVQTGGGAWATARRPRAAAGSVRRGGAIPRSRCSEPRPTPAATTMDPRSSTPVSSPPSGGERWPSARTRKVGGDRSAPRVDRFVLAPLVKIMRAALARRDHPRAAAAAALVLTATRGRDGEPRDDDPNARSVTVGHWTRGSRERAEYGEAEHAAIHAAIEILRETGGRARPTTAAAPRLGATSTRKHAAAPNNNNAISRTGAAHSPPRRRSGCWSSPGGARSAGRTPTRRTSFASRRCTTKS